MVNFAKLRHLRDFMHNEEIDQIETIPQLRQIIAELTEKLAKVQQSHSALTMRIQKIVTSFPCGLIIVNQDLRIEALNKSALSFFEYSLEEIVRQPLTLLCPELSSLAANQEPMQTNAVRKSGERFAAEILVNRLEIKGSDRLFINIQDVTERQRLDRLRADLVSAVSHDVRAPLTSVLITLDMLSAGHYGQINERGEKNVANARSSILYLELLVRNLLDNDSIERGGFTINRADTTIGAIVSKAASIVNEINEKATVRIETEITNDAIKVDEQALMQVLINLLVNAVNHSPENSVVRVEAGIEGVQAKFKVIDYGSGIPKEQQHRIFERYTKLEKHRGRGFGLGLAICEDIVEKHGGRIWVESETGAGSRFILTVPFED